MRFARAAVLPLLLSLACNKSPTAVAAVDPLVLTAIAATRQSAVVANRLPAAPAVRVTRDSQPVAGVRVTFAQPREGGLFIGSILSDTAGAARFPGGYWDAPSVAGPDSIIASIDGAPPVLFIAVGIPAPPSQYLKAGGDAQKVPAGMPLTVLPAVKVMDWFQNGVPGVSVNFVLMSGGGTITGGTTVTGANGVATLSGWTLGSTPGTNTVTAYVQPPTGAVIPFTFTETGLATSSAVGRSPR